jgi:hypothetical protein
MAKVNRVGRSFSTLPFDGIDSVENLWIHDDFLGVLPVADIGTGTIVHTAQSTWNAAEVGTLTGPGTINGLVGAAGHPGILQLQTADDANEEVALLLGAQARDEADEDFVLDTNGIYMSTILRIPDVDGQRVEFGLVGQLASPNSSALDLVSFVWDPSDAANVDDELFLAQINSAGTDVEEAFSLKYVEGDWAQLEIYATSTDAYFRLTTEDGQETINLTPAAMPIVALRPAYINEAVGTAVESLDIDAFHLRYERRHQAANAGISWLGQSGA